uniref:Rho GTPase activating protein 12 n=1 Tax=Oryzias melastigma TaxID=30732 RepID=A0A3B3CYL6_ORYME
RLARGGPPGEVYIEVDYDYEYKSKDRLISIHQGERYLLVKKTNEDWWQVKKDDGTKAFYVPAQYVREVRKALMPPPKPFPHHPGGASKIPQTGSSYWVNPSHLDLGLKDQAAEGLSRHESKSQRSPSAQTASSGHFTPPSRRRNSSPRHSPLTPTDHDRAPTEIIVQEAGPQESQKGLSATLPRGRARSPNRDGLDVDSTYCDSAGEDRRTNDSESGDELSGSSTEQLQMDPPGQVSSDSSIYTNLQELKISQANMPPQPSGSPLHVSGDWETHKDQTGRQYYYNPFTQERTWKPPRTKDINNGNPRGESHSPSEKCGVLNMTKITENGRRVRKNWTSSWTVLQGSELLFAKGQASGSSWFGGGQSKPEFAVDLKGASVEWASKDKSSKKNVIELKIPNGTDLLIQSDNDGTITEWFNALEETIRSHVRTSAQTLSLHPPSEHKLRLKCSKAAASTEPADTKKTKHKLKKFLTRRPTLQAVRDRGYIKDQVFGCSLASLCQRENSTVPHFVKLCIDHVESKGLSIDGLYRVSGNLAVIQKLRFAVNHDEKVNLSDAKWEDIHVTTGALKMFFRELPEPLFTYALFQQFVTAIKTQEYRQRVQAIKDLVKQLPKPNHDTMQTLFKHLRRVIDHGEENRMTTQSIAIVFGPTLLRPETETWNMAVHMVYQNQIVDLILLEYENIFSR